MGKRLAFIGLVSAGAVAIYVWRESARLRLDAAAAEPEPAPTVPPESAEDYDFVPEAPPPVDDGSTRENVEAEPLLEPIPSPEQPPEAEPASAPIRVVGTPALAIAGEGVEWTFSTLPQPGSRGRHLAAPLALAASRPPLTVGAAVVLINLLLITTVVSAGGFADVGDLLSRWISIVF